MFNVYLQVYLEVYLQVRGNLSGHIKKKKANLFSFLIFFRLEGTKKLVVGEILEAN